MDYTDYTRSAGCLMNVLMNSILVGREVVNNIETERSREVKKATKVSATLSAQLAFGIPISFVFMSCVVPLYSRQNETFRAVI